MESFTALNKATRQKNGPQFAAYLSITHQALTSLAYVSDDYESCLQALTKLMPSDKWATIYALHWKVAYEIVRKQDLVAAYEAENSLLVALNRMAEKTARWILPALSTVAKELRQLAILADKTSSSASHLEEATRAINRSFQLCLNDRSTDLSNSRKWGIYFFIGELFKIYFMLHKQGLGKNMLRALDSVEHPALTEYPASHIVTVSYYIGVSHFIEEKYQEAETHLTAAWNLCHNDATKNQEKILLYLIPVKLLSPLWKGGSGNKYLPSKRLLAKYPRLSLAYEPLIDSLVKGNIDRYNKLLLQRRSMLVSKYLYLAFEKAQLLASRNLVYKAYKILGSNSRLPVQEVSKALEIANYYPYEPENDDDKLNQTEGLVATLISFNLVKGYISHERRTVVLRAENAFVF